MKVIASVGLRDSTGREYSRDHVKGLIASRFRGASVVWADGLWEWIMSRRRTTTRRCKSMVRLYGRETSSWRKRFGSRILIFSRHWRSCLDGVAREVTHMKAPVDQIIAFESGELGSHDVVRLFAGLVKSGLAWTLQGYYGRRAARLIKAGFISREGNVLRLP